MIRSDIPAYRLINQQIAKTNFTQPAEIVHWLGAMQAQEFAMAKWAIALRLPAINDVAVEEAFNNGSILRTHLLRPTWHFVTPADIRWMLQLSAPRVIALNSFMYRKLELDSALFKRSNDVLVKTLQGGKQLTRAILKTALEREKIEAEGFRLAYIFMQAELDGLICSGGRQGKQFTYALLEERVPATRAFTKAEALAELANRYFSSRGPATLKDFVTWSGLTMKEAKEGVAALSPGFVCERIDGQAYIFEATMLPAMKGLQVTFLMPDYDEYGMGYKDRSAILKNSTKKSDPNTNGSFIPNRMLIIDGQISGTWQPVIKGNSVAIEMALFAPLNKTKQLAVLNGAKRYSTFLGKIFTGIKQL